MSAHSYVQKQRTDQEYIASNIHKRVDNLKPSSSIKFPSQINLTSDLYSEEYISLQDNANFLMDHKFPETPTKQDVDDFKTQMYQFIRHQLAFTRTINESNHKLRTSYENLPYESPRLDQIEHDLKTNFQTMKTLNAKGRDIQALSAYCIPVMEKKIAQLED